MFGPGVNLSQTKVLVSEIKPLSIASRLEFVAVVSPFERQNVRKIVGGDSSHVFNFSETKSHKNSSEKELLFYFGVTNKAWK